jgi:predicted component of type VI protein secretion system
MATAMSGAAHELNTLALLLGGSQYGPYHQRGKFLPASLKMRFDVQDDWIDQVQSEIHNTRAMAHERNLGDGAVTVRVVREQMMSVGEITEAQFREMELEDGRTQDGLPVDVLFYGDNPYLRGIDPDDFTEQEVKEKLKEAKRASVSESGEQRTLAKEAVKALEWLLEPEEEEEERPDVAKPHEDAPMRKLPEMTSTGVTDGSSAFSEKERTPIERQMQNEIRRIFKEYEPQAETAVVEDSEFDYDGLKEALTVALITYLIRAFLDQMAELEQEYDISFDPAEMAAAANEWATGYAPEEAERLMGTTRRVIDGVAAKYAAGEIAREQIGEMLEPAFNKNRASLIAITLITVALSYAFHDYTNLLERYGLRLETYWVTADDERVCSICAPLHNQPSAIWQAQFPEGPPAHGRCRCGQRLEVIRE